jgi:hypothetical protein
VADRQLIAGLPFFAAGSAAPAPAFEAGAPFWRALDKLTPDDRLLGQLDQLLAGASAPRVWLLLHEPGQPQLSAVATLMLARALTGRGQNVLVMDVDEVGSALTIWTEREETEGWIDVARFGASVLGAGIPLPFRGGRGTLLGIGSFVPTDVTEGEIISLLGRLRHQADDILLVAAVGAAALPWARLAERRLFCWDRTVRDADQLGPVAGPFAASGVPLTGLLGYGDPATIAVPVPAAQVPAPVVEPPLPPAAPEVDVPRPIPAGVLPSELSSELSSGPLAASTSAPEPPAEAAPPEPVPSPLPPPVPAIEPVVHPAARPAGRPVRPEIELGAETEAPRGTPRMFWLATGVFVAALVVIAWYWSAYVRVPPGGYFAPVVTRVETTPAIDDSLPPDDSSAPDHSSSSVSSAVLPQPSVDATAGRAADGDGRSVAEAGGLVSIGDTLPGARVQEPATPVASAAPAASPPAATATRGGADRDGTPRFDPAAYAVPAGQAGWALHLYSLPDSDSAAKQAAELERAGYRTAVRIVEIKEKGGRWWRLYVGSFPSRAAARAAMPALLARLGATWAEPARIQESTP